MRIREYLKNLWDDESGQYNIADPWAALKKGWGTIVKGQYNIADPWAAAQKAWSAVKPAKPSYGGSVSPQYPTYYKGGGGSVSPTYQYTAPEPIPPPPPVIGDGAGAGGAVTGGGAYNIPGFPTYSLPTYRAPAVNLNIPSFAWSPTEEQRAGWGETAKTRAGLVIDPQRQAEMEALESYKSEVTGQMGEINPRMTKMSLALANMVENTMKQDIIDELIRRGATTSGELPRQLGEAGRYEVEQRRGVEEERNRLIGELQRGQLGREELSGERLTELERMRGMQEASELFEQERYERGAVTAEKSALFEAQLAQASLQNQIASAQYESAYKQRLFEAEMGQQTWERGFSEQQLALQRATAAYAQQPEPEVEKTDIEQMIEELTRRQLEGMLGSSAYTKPTGPYSHAGLPGFY